MLRFTEEEYELYVLKKNKNSKNNKNKYGAKKTKLDDIKFDSKGEANRYAELKLLEKSGIINKLVLQPRFLLQESFTRDSVTYNIKR